MEMMEIPHLEERLEAFIFKRTFRERLGSVAGELSTLIRACEQVRSWWWGG